MPKSDAYSVQTRTMVDNMREDIGEIKASINNLDNKVTDLFNHQSNRWPPGAVWAVSTIGTLLGAVATLALEKFFG